MSHTALDVADLGEFGTAAERLAELEGSFAIRAVGERGRLVERLERAKIERERKERRRAKKRSVLSSVIQLGITAGGLALPGIGPLAGAALASQFGGPLAQAITGARPSPAAAAPGALAGSIEDIRREREREKRLRELFEER